MRSVTLAVIALLAPAHARASGAPDSTPPLPAWRGTFRRDVAELGSRRSLVIFGSGAALAGASLLVEDPARQSNDLEQSPVDGASDFGNFWGNGLVLGALAGGLMLAGHVASAPNVGLAGAEMARSLIYAGAIVGTLKLVIPRERPNGGSHSFPSGHSAAAFAVAPVFSERFGWVAAIPAYALATFTALGRIEENEHYLSDVVFGASVGIATGTAVCRSDRGAHGVALLMDPRRFGLSVRF